MRKFPILIILISIILLGGCFVNSHDYDEEIIIKAEEIAENYIRSNYENIETIEFIAVEENSMGAMQVKGVVNGNAEFTVNTDEESFEVGSIVTKGGFPDRKEECKNGGCDY